MSELKMTITSCLCFFFLMIRRPPRSTPLSLHDALPISPSSIPRSRFMAHASGWLGAGTDRGDRKSTRLNSSHITISYAVFCLKKKKKKKKKLQLNKKKKKKKKILTHNKKK